MGKNFLYEHFFLRSWWVYLFVIVCTLVYTHAMRKKRESYESLAQQMQKLEIEKQVATEVHEDLLLQINSQYDPAWIQLLLMKSLGLVPEGQTKVHFRGE